MERIKQFVLSRNGLGSPEKWLILCWALNVKKSASRKGSRVTYSKGKRTNNDLEAGKGNKVAGNLDGSRPYINGDMLYYSS